MNRCPECGTEASLVTRARPRSVVYRGLKLDLNPTLALTECTNCNEAFVDETEGIAHDKAIAEAYAESVAVRAATSTNSRRR